MSRYLNMPSISMPSNYNEWIEAYKKILLNIIYFGLFLFIGGIYIFPNDSGTQQTFYLLVVLPFLLVFPFILKELPWTNKYLCVYMAFPLYMFVSYFWASEENIQRGWFFFFRQLVCFLVFICSLFLIIEGKKNFTIKLWTFLILIGFGSTAISLIQHLYLYENYMTRALLGFSVVDVDKVGMISAFHFALCLVALVYYNIRKNRLVYSLFLMAAMAQDGVAIYLTHTLGNQLLLIAAILLVAIRGFRNQKFSLGLLFVFSLAAILLVLYLVSINHFSEYNIAIRVDVIKTTISQWSINPVLGQGLTYKSPLVAPEFETVLVHPHNFFADTLRFGGVIGLGFLCVHIVYPISECWISEKDRIVATFLIVWACGGVLACSFYGQQPFVRPGSYIWFMYWIPIALLYATQMSKSQTKK